MTQSHPGGDLLSYGIPAPGVPVRVPRPPPRPASAPAPSSGLADLTVALILDFASVALGRLAALVARDE